MTDARSDRELENWRESSEKFDYFMAGLSAALVGYLAPTLEAAKLGLTPPTLEFVAMLALIGSTFAGFKRIESGVHLLRLGVSRLENSESASRLASALNDSRVVVDQDSQKDLNAEQVKELYENRRTLVKMVKDLEEKISSKYDRWYRIRYYLLIAGFILILAARIWKGYRL